MLIPNTHSTAATFTFYDKKHNNEIEYLLEIHFFEIGKAVKHYKNDKKHKWLKFLNTSDPKELEDFKKNNNDDFVEKGVNIVNTINADVRFKNIIQMIEESEHEKAHFIDMAEQRGREEGRAEGREEGRAEGREEGRAEGREEGRAEGEAIGLERGRAEIIESMRQSGMTEEQIKAILSN